MKVFAPRLFPSQ